MKQITKEECPECKGALRSMYARDHFMCMDCKIEYQLVTAQAPPKKVFQTTIPVLYENEVVGKLDLSPDVVEVLERKMESKLRCLNTQPFVLNMTFQIETESTNFTLCEMNILDTNNEA